ncbi:hypothetical protein Tco_0045271 [Tanacetum coccineum]
MNLFSLLAIQSYGGNFYTFVIVDDYSRRVERGEASTSSTKQPVKEVEEVNVHENTSDQDSKVHKESDMILKNKFSVLNEEEENGVTSVYEPSHDNIVNASDSEDVDEEIFMEDDRGKMVDTMGASTPNDTVINVTRICKGFVPVSLDIGNGLLMRRSLWSNLGLHKLYVCNRPWCLLGDFNAALFLDDFAVGSSNIDISMREFKACVENIEVLDVQQAGLKFTWNQKPKGKDGILKKLDRVLTNLEFNDLFQGAHAIFQPYRISDHAPAVLKIPWKVAVKPKPFKFTNILIKNPKFKEVILGTWNHSFSGFYMYQVVQKLKCLKKPFRKLLYDTGHIHENVKKLRFELDVVQRALNLDTSNNTLREEEAVNVQAFNELILLEEMFLRQKAKIGWLWEGDSNSAYFHKAVKSRVSRSRIDVVSNSDGVLFENEHVSDAFVAHYEAFLGHPGTVSDVIMTDLFLTRLDVNNANDIIRMVSDTEIKNAMFSMGNEKSPGPDGFTAAFFKEAWDIVGKDVILAVREFFINGKLLKEMNHTIIALIPKVSTPARVNDFQPISCCNVLFKCISKIIANRIKSSLKVLISPNQSAFVPGRSIADNILLTQEIMHNYHLNHGTPRCAFKVDIQKAYDTVDWCFLRKILMGFGFHDRMVGWIMECVTTTSFSICVNGSLHGYFKGKRGLRQVRLRELCFADDLFLFAHGNTNSARVIMESLEEFKIVSGLVPSLPKSTAYFCNVTNHVKMSILQILPFEEGRLPVKYLGVPLVSSQMIYKDCKELFEKVQHRVDDWKNKSLSIAGRLQLVNFVIGLLHVFWASVFMLPTRILLDIEQIMRGFLWCNGKLRSGKAKVAWEVVCLPKDEGGLGIRRLDTFNKALMTTHVWKLLTRKESLWVQWIHAYKLRGRSFWDVPYRGNMSWGWRNILKLRPLIRDFIWHKIGDGSGTSVWFDRWCEQSPLAAIVTSRDIFREGFSSNSKVCDLVRNGSLLWPPCWLSKYPSLFSIPSPTLVPNSSDTLEWRDESGFARGFSAHVVWNTIRHRNDKVDWCDVVWFSCCIPRHAVHLWLVLRRRLKTQDQLRLWDATGVMVCPLCETQPDSHDHLFFECVYSQQVWHGLKALAGLPNSSDAMDEVVSDILPFATRRTSKSIIAKLVVAATLYFIWQERNCHLFKKSKRTVNQVVECIMHTIRLKLLSCHFKTTRSALELINAWNLSESILVSILWHVTYGLVEVQALLEVSGSFGLPPTPVHLFEGWCDGGLGFLGLLLLLLIDYKRTIVYRKKDRLLQMPLLLLSPIKAAMVSNVYAALAALKITPVRRNTLEKHTWYTEKQVMRCAKFMTKMHLRLKDDPLKKQPYGLYSCEARGAVAFHPPATFLFMPAHQDSINTTKNVPPHMEALPSSRSQFELLITDVKTPHQRLSLSMTVVVSRMQITLDVGNDSVVVHSVKPAYGADMEDPQLILLAKGCAFKVDIQKAYDTVDWVFLRRILYGFGFHSRKRGLRQGDPLSPYLFTLVMEVLTLMLQRRVMETDSFSYHRYCDKLDLINLCFADDLFLFAYGDVQSASIIKDALDEFKHASGLTPSLPKSTAYFCNVLNHIKLSILSVLPFEEGKAAVK